MSKDTDLIEKLKLMGFSEYASKAFIALVKLGEASAPSIASKADVPQSKIYGVLDDLYEKGFVGRTTKPKGKEKEVAHYFAFKPVERFAEWLQQFADMAKDLEDIYDTAGPSYEYGYYSVGNFSGKLNAKDYLYIFDQSDDFLYEYFTGKIANYYRVGGSTNALLGITKKGFELLIEKENRVQYISIDEPLFYRMIELVFTLSPENRAITGDMRELVGDEYVLFVDSIMSASGAVTGQHGLLWLTEKRLFIQIGGRDPYARPLAVVENCSVTPDGSLLVIVKTKGGVEEMSEIYTYSDPALVENLVNFIKNKK